MGFNISSDVCNQLTIKHDRDRSGMLDINEFTLIVSELNQWKDAFCYFDSDRSGRLNFQEFSNALSRIGYRFPPQLVTLIFTNLDANHTGYLDLGAFIKTCSVIQIVILKMQQYDPQRTGFVRLDLNQMLDIVFSIPMSFVCCQSFFLKVQLFFCFFSLIYNTD